MHFKIWTVIISVLVFAHNLFGVAPVLSDKALSAPPPRIIRTCCSFGSDLRMMMVPGAKYTDITERNAMGDHKFMGDNNEMNGIIYSQRGGFIDMGHLRDQADWTAYIYLKIKENISNGIYKQKLGNEGGAKMIEINIPKDIEDEDIMKISGRVAYDLSVWHEIATWFGCSYVPLIPERYSSFSPEDAYSNLLGATLGIKALKSEFPYEVAMTNLIKETLDSMEAVNTKEETYEAMESVRGLWWTREKPLPSAKILLLREVSVYTCTQPWLIPTQNTNAPSPIELEIPQYTNNGKSLSEYYKLSFKLNHKFPFKKIFPDRKNRIITQLDFQAMLNRVSEELAHKGFEYK